MANLFIVEAPGKVHKIQQILDQICPGEFRVAASIGHICDLPMHDIGFTYPDFSPNYEISKDKSKTVAELRRLAKASEVVVLATDLDREGEAIAFHLKRVLGLSDDNYIRVKYNSLDKKTIEDALQNGEELDMAMVASQETRRFLDRMIGYYLYTPISQALGGKYPVGRVQSAVLFILCELEDLLKNFKSHEHYNLEATLKTGWSAKWDFSNWLTEEHKEQFGNQWRDKISITQLQQALDQKQLSITSVETKPSSRKAPAPFITVDLQAAAASRLGLDLKQTMKAAQKLYEGGFITYHRTDAPVISEQGMQLLEAFATREGITITPNKAKSRDGAQEAHECIRPSDFFVMGAGDTKDEKDLYQLIWLRTVASQMPPAEYDVKSVVATYKDVELTIDGEVIKQDVNFKASSRLLKEDGWLGLLKTYSLNENALEYVEGEEDADQEQQHTFPADIAVGQVHDIVAAKMISTKTKPRSRYTVASLVKLLEKRGIGRPSTYQSIFDRLLSHGYIKVVKKKVEVTEHGMTLIENIKDKFSFVNPHYTKGIEEILDQIAEGEINYKDELRKFHLELESQQDYFTTQWLESFPFHQCQSCNTGRMLPKVGTNTDKTTSVYWSCNVCKASAPNKVVDGKNHPGKPTQRENTLHLCNCGQNLVQVTTEKAVFFECSQRAFVNGACSATYRAVNTEQGIWPDYEEYQRNHTYKCQFNGCDGWLRELQGVSEKSGKPYHFFACEKANDRLKSKKCKSTLFDVMPDGSPNYEPRHQQYMTEHLCICQKPLTYHKYRKELNVYNTYYKCETSCGRNFEVLPDGTPDVQLTLSRTNNIAKCFDCGQDMVQSAYTNRDGHRKHRWDCFSCYAFGYDKDGKPVKPSDKTGGAKSKSKSKK